MYSKRTVLPIALALGLYLTGQDSCCTDNDEDGWTGCDGDCDDMDSTIHPGATEVCDGLDNDCSDAIDDNGACSQVVGYYGDHAYLFGTDSSNWSTALNICESYGYSLAAINDAEENAWLVSTATSISYSSYWIGFNDRRTEGTFVWASGDEVTYTNWNSGEPNNAGEEDCTQMYESSYWNDLPCDSYYLPYICETTDRPN